MLENSGTQRERKSMGQKIQIQKHKCEQEDQRWNGEEGEGEQKIQPTWRQGQQIKEETGTDVLGMRKDRR